jgi:hypothetical protein
MGVFRKAGFDAIAYPVAYRTPWQWDFDPARNLRIFEIAMREWIGLLAYWATGRIDQPFPAPGQELGWETAATEIPAVRPPHMSQATFALALNASQIEAEREALPIAGGSRM